MGFLADTSIPLPHPVRLGISDRILSFDLTSQQRRIWRLDAAGKLGDVWGYPELTFTRSWPNGTFPSLVFGTDGAVYYL